MVAADDEADPRRHFRLQNFFLGLFTSYVCAREGGDRVLRSAAGPSSAGALKFLVGAGSDRPQAWHNESQIRRHRPCCPAHLVAPWCGELRSAARQRTDRLPWRAERQLPALLPIAMLCVARLRVPKVCGAARQRTVPSDGRAWRRHVPEFG